MYPQGTRLYRTMAAALQQAVVGKLTTIERSLQGKLKAKDKRALLSERERIVAWVQR